MSKLKKGDICIFYSSCREEIITYYIEDRIYGEYSKDSRVNIDILNILNKNKDNNKYMRLHSIEGRFGMGTRAYATFKDVVPLIRRLRKWKKVIFVYYIYSFLKNYIFIN